MVKVKICGLKRPEEMHLCQSLGVNWVGFIFYPPSPRFISAEQALFLHQSASSSQNGGPARVGLFVNPTFSDVEKILSVLPLDVLQLYAPLEQCLAFKQHFQITVWQARGIKSVKDLPQQGHHLDGYIIESPADDLTSQPGGLGKSFDWTLTQNWSAPVPWLLAGGLTPENVQEALKTSGAHAVDVSSGVEERKGIKSLQKIEKFVRNARNGVA